MSIDALEAKKMATASENDHILIHSLLLTNFTNAILGATYNFFLTNPIRFRMSRIGFDVKSGVYRVAKLWIHLIAVHNQR